MDIYEMVLRHGVTHVHPQYVVIIAKFCVSELEKIKYVKRNNSSNERDLLIGSITYPVLVIPC